MQKELTGCYPHVSDLELALLDHGFIVWLDRSQFHVEEAKHGALGLVLLIGEQDLDVLDESSLYCGIP